MRRCVECGTFACECNAARVSCSKSVARQIWKGGARLVSLEEMYHLIYVAQRATQRNRKPSRQRQAYLNVFKSKRFKAVREWVMERDSWTCKAPGCGSQDDLEAHHIHYDTLGSETGWELITLCKWCHKDADARRRELLAAFESLITLMMEHWKHEHPDEEYPVFKEAA